MLKAYPHTVIKSWPVSCKAVIEILCSLITVLCLAFADEAQHVYMHVISNTQIFILNEFLLKISEVTNTASNFLAAA